MPARLRGPALVGLSLLAGAAPGCSRRDNTGAATSATLPLPVPPPPAWPAPLAGAAPGLRFLGRTLPKSETAAEYAWSGGGFRARFVGTGLSVTLNDHENVHALWIDGQAQSPVVTERKKSNYVLASGLPAGEHTVELVRRTEALFGVTHVLGVNVEGGELLPPPAPKARQIEVLGDSISAGYGNLGPNTSCHFSPETEDYSSAYSALLGRSLDADVSTVAWSGRGVVKNYDGEAGTLMPELYLRVLPEVETSRWNFSNETQAVVVNLGTNDFSTEPDPAPDAFAGAYQALLERVRASRPRAFILCTLGPMLSAADLARAAQAIQSAISARVRAGDERVVYHALQTPNEAPGCDWHPSVATHAKMATELASELGRHLEW